MANGIVYLVGAGPGDPGLLTLKARDLLALADCVVYDYLVNPEILAHAPAQAERIFVGKRGGEQCISQAEINALLIEKARQYARVVRLKGGDPFVYGRGGEEALELAAAGIAWQVVPGVTAGLAAPAYAGIPVTQRGMSSSVTFVTAHEDPEKNPTSALNYAQLHADTLVVYMGVGRLRQLAETLLEAGRNPATPVAVIRWATYAKQEVYVSDLQTIASLAASHSLQAPAIIVIGEVVRLREQLQWFQPAELVNQAVPSA